MTNYRLVWLPVVILMLVAASGAWAQILPSAPVNLFEAMQRGEVWAQFRGAGAYGVSGTVGRMAQFPGQLGIPSGTQFLGQRPGVQGMTTLGSTRIDLSGQAVASVWIPAACTNLGLQTPTPADIMIPAPTPDERLARLATVWDFDSSPHAARQLAVWAVTDDPHPIRLMPFFQEVAPGQDWAAVEGRVALMDNAQRLLRWAGLEPAAFRMFH